MFEVTKTHYSSLEELFNKNRKLVFVIINDLVFEQEAREDIFSMVWMKISERPDKYMAMEIDYFRNYLRIMIKTIVADYFRKEKLEQAKAEKAKDSDAAYNDFEEIEFYADEAPYLERAKAVLSPEEREIIRLKFYENRKAKEIGEIFNITEGNVRARQKRILAKLKKEIVRLMKEDGNDGR